MWELAANSRWHAHPEEKGAPDPVKGQCDGITRALPRATLTSRSVS